MEDRDVSRRTLLKGGGVALAGLSLQVAAPARAFPQDNDRQEQAWDDEHQPDPSESLGRPGDVVLQWLDQRPGDPPRPLPEASSSGKSSTPG